jgi:DNA-binding PadR family transcriptional regulator
MNTKTIESLSPQVVYILLALAVKERHGYEIMKQVRQDSHGKITLGPGTLYGAIKRLLKDGWVAEAGERELAGKADERRRYYRLTELGRKQLATELRRYEATLELARNNHFVGPAYEMYSTFNN